MGSGFALVTLYVHGTLELLGVQIDTTINVSIIFVVTLTLGSRPKQGLAKVRAKNEAWESHFMFSKV